MQARAYTAECLDKALSAVKQRKRKVRSAAREFGVPKSTLHDRLKKVPPSTNLKKCSRLLTAEEELGLVAFIQYMAGQGFPMTRTMVRCYVRELLRRSGRVSTVNKDSGPSDKWFRSLLKRHPQLSERTPENMDKSRTRMSSQKTMDEWFQLLNKVLEDNGIKNKESRIFNVDEVGFSGKERQRTKVIGPKQGHIFSGKIITNDHVTVNMCICADGKILPSMVIYKESLPHRNYTDGVPDSWLFGTSQTGYMDGDLFLSWFKRIFLLNCGRERPVILILDNHDSHVTLHLVETARANDVILLGMPAHTTHILQPLDVKVFGPLKSRFSSLATNLGFANPNLTIGKSKFPVVLRHAVEQTTPSSVREAFVVTGIVPYNPDAIDTSQLIPPTFSKRNEETGRTESCSVHTCEMCGSFLANPLVNQGLIPQSMAQILIPPPKQPAKIQAKRSRVVTEGRVISGDEMLKQLKEKEQMAKKEQEAKEERARQKEKRKEEIQREMEEKLIKKQKREEERKIKASKREEEKMKKALGGRLADKKFMCGVCGERGRMNDEYNGVMWYGCDECESWYHEECLGRREREFLSESMEECSAWYCRKCKPWLYDEE